MFDGASAPPAQSGVTWSTCHPGHAPRTKPVDGQGFAPRNARTSERDRCIPLATASSDNVSASRQTSALIRELSCPAESDFEMGAWQFANFAHRDLLRLVNGTRPTDGDLRRASVNIFDA
jgi:hypothetical protein